MAIGIACERLEVLTPLRGYFCGRDELTTGSAGRSTGIAPLVATSLRPSGANSVESLRMYLQLQSALGFSTQYSARFGVLTRHSVLSTQHSVLCTLHFPLQSRRRVLAINVGGSAGTHAVRRTSDARVLDRDEQWIRVESS
jgi:hypothetical protein